MTKIATSNKLASALAYAGAFLFALLIVLFNTMPQSIAINLTGVAFHLVLFPVVAALPAPEWSRAAGYGWLVLDTACNIMSLNGVDIHLVMPLRLGSHIMAALWVGTVSLNCSTIIKAVGILFSIAIAGYSLTAPWVPEWALFPSMLLLITWLVLTGSMLSKPEKNSLQT